MNRSISYGALVAGACLAGSALAQTPAAARAGALVAAGPLGRPEHSTLHPIAPILTGRPASELPTDKLKVPAGFKVEVYADGIPEARSLALGDKGTVFVSNRNLKDVYAITDQGGKRTVTKVLKGLNAPNGVAFKDGTLYVAERHRITAYDGIEDRLATPPEARVVIDNLDPQQQAGHFWKFLAMGPDGKLYYNVGAPGNIVMPAYYQATINRVDPKTGVTEVYASGVRNSRRLRLGPAHQGALVHQPRARLGERRHAEDTLHRAARKGMNFGYPFCHQGDLLDPDFGKGRACGEFDAPAARLGAHIAPLGLRFYTGSMFPAEYRNGMFIAMHGSWNRTSKQGYNVMHASVGRDGKVTLKPFLEGFLQDAKADPPMWGRPVDVLVMKDGALLVSDDYNGIVYRVSYAK